ncbi:MAG TPA: KTSC domain-containing protein [Alphaproteobacteria bacterium]
MQRIPLRSVVLRAVGYDPVTRTLEAEFRTGRIYRYAGVPPELFLSLLVARSKGRFFNIAVRDFYPYREVTPGAARDEAERQRALAETD